jgi:hypothetical protein
MPRFPAVFAALVKSYITAAFWSVKPLSTFQSVFKTPLPSGCLSFARALDAEADGFLPQLPLTLPAHRQVRELVDDLFAHKI